MNGDVAKPFYSGGLQRGVVIQSLCDGTGDEGLAFFGQPVQQLPLLPDQPVDLRRLIIQKPRNLPLCVERRRWHRIFSIALSTNVLDC